jgi:hypothetical protein
MKDLANPSYYSENLNYFDSTTKRLGVFRQTVETTREKR